MYAGYNIGDYYISIKPKGKNVEWVVEYIGSSAEVIVESGVDTDHITLHKILGAVSRYEADRKAKRVIQE